MLIFLESKKVFVARTIVTNERNFPFKNKEILPLLEDDLLGVKGMSGSDFHMTVDIDSISDVENTDSISDVLVYESTNRLADSISTENTDSISDVENNDNPNNMLK